MAVALTKTERVVQQVRQMIISGELAKGDMLPSENILSDICGVSRVTIRKALTTLAEMGLIQTRRGVGSFVLVDSMPGESSGERAEILSRFRSRFSEALQIKRLIDPELSMWLALHAKEEDLLKIESALDKCEASFQNNAAYAAAGHEFHMAFVCPLGNETLLNLYKKLEEMESPYTQIALLDTDRQIEIKKLDLAQHRAILNAIKAHDQDKASYLTKVHLDYFEEYYEAGAGI